MLIMYYVPHLYTEMEAKQPTKMPKSTPKNTKQTSPIV